MACHLAFSSKLLFAQTRVFWELGFPFGSQSALVYQPDEHRQLRGVYIISPGGELPSEAMSGLAKAFADEGYFSFIVEHPQNLAILDTISARGNAAVNLAEAIRSDTLVGLEATPLSELPIYLFGHSLGGATLSKAVYGRSLAVDGVVLYGVGQIITWPSRKRASGPALAVLIGENDGLSPKGLPAYLKPLGVSFEEQDPLAYSNLDASIVYKRIKGLNHFCIVTDQTKGNPILKARDGQGPSHSSCLAELMGQLSELNMLP